MTLKPTISEAPWTLPPDETMMCSRIGRAIMDVVVWLRSLGLGKYEAAFRENEIAETVLPNLTAQDLKELGVIALGPDWIEIRR